MNDTAIVKAVWDLATIFNIGRLRTEASLSAEADYRYQGAREATAARLAKMFVAEARVFAVEVNEDDLQIKFDDHPEVPESIRGRCFWQPKTHTVRLTGGHVDGAEVEVRDVWQPYMVPEPITFASLVDESPLPMITGVLRYQLSGWSETDRIWIFSND